MIASVQFKHFKALRATSLRLEPFNLVIGPNGSGKTSLIQAMLRLRTLARRAGPMAGGDAAEPAGATARRKSCSVSPRPTTTSRCT